MAQDYELLKDMIQEIGREVKEIRSNVESHHAQCMESFNSLNLEIKSRAAEQSARHGIFGALVSSSGPFGLAIALAVAVMTYFHK